jgi:phosphopantothenoylcysteine decarboxylase / phosphopantothenate---cysteine ligase
MQNLKGKKIIIGVSGSIAAYKSALLVRLLIKSGAEVQVIMTEAACDFITPLTLSVLSKKTVLSSFTDSRGGSWNNHVELGLWADAFIVAPATARTLAKCAQGNCDDLLTATYLSARCPVFFAPAMDLDMYKHGSTVQNLKLLLSFGNKIIDPGHGELASGLTGDGRMAEPEIIVSELSKHFANTPVAVGKNVLITAGPTVELIDPVRFISNKSSGKMGYAIARAFSNAGANVTLVTGPTNLSVENTSIKRVDVQTADEMLHATKTHFDKSDVIIYAAAVADYRPLNVATQKIKKQGDEMVLELVKTRDIAGTLADEKRANQIVIGFALETENEVDHAMEKLTRKNFDYIVLNSLNDAGAGFVHDTNKITVISRLKEITRFPLKTKDEVAQDLLNIIVNKWSEI